MDFVSPTLQNAHINAESKFHIMITCTRYYVCTISDTDISVEYNQLNQTTQALYQKLQQLCSCNVSCHVIRSTCWFLRENDNVASFWNGLLSYGPVYYSDCIWLIAHNQSCAACGRGLKLKSIRNTQIVTSQGIVDGLDITLQCNINNCNMFHKSVSYNSYQIGSRLTNDLNYQYWDNNVKNTELWHKIFSRELNLYVSLAPCIVTCIHTTQNTKTHNI